MKVDPTTIGTGEAPGDGEYSFRSRTMVTANGTARDGPTCGGPVQSADSNEANAVPRIDSVETLNTKMRPPAR
jgi:hypothetical protein